MALRTQGCTLGYRIWPPWGFHPRLGTGSPIMSQEPSADRFDDITIFTTADGATRVAVRFQNENVWLTQKLMAELYECSTDNVGLHLKNIFAERELDEKSVTEESSATAADGAIDPDLKATTDRILTMIGGLTK